MEDLLMSLLPRRKIFCHDPDVIVIIVLIEHVDIVINWHRHLKHLFVSLHIELAMDINRIRCRCCQTPSRGSGVTVC